jgi:hypothetical protein
VKAENLRTCDFVLRRQTLNEKGAEGPLAANLLPKSDEQRLNKQVKPVEPLRIINDLQPLPAVPKGFADLSLGPLGYRAKHSSIANLQKPSGPPAGEECASRAIFSPLERASRLWLPAGIWPILPAAWG